MRLITTNCLGRVRRVDTEERPAGIETSQLPEDERIATPDIEHGRPLGQWNMPSDEPPHHVDPCPLPRVAGRRNELPCARLNEVHEGWPRDCTPCRDRE